MISAFSIKATGLHSCIVNWSIFDKIRVKIAKSYLPFLLQLYKNTTPIIAKPNIDTSVVVIEAHDISLLDQGHRPPQLHIVNWSIFDKIRVKIAKSDLPYLPQLYKN